MTKRILTIELEYDAETIHGGDDDIEAKEWFEKNVLGKEMILHSNEIGDTIGIVRVIQAESDDLNL